MIIMKRKKNSGSWLVESLVILLIFLILAALAIKLVSNVVQKSKVVSAKAQIAQLSLLLEAVKDDTGYYPAFLSNLTLVSPPNLQEDGWKGAYTRIVPLDPWGSPYFYQIPPTTLFNSPPLPRTTGTPDTYTLFFETNPGKGILRIENYGVTACDVTLNGVIVVYEYEFKNNPRPQIIEKEVDLLPGNNFLVWARSKPGEFLVANISADNVPTREYFILGSYGKDKQGGGTGFDMDIIWHSKYYPNFLPDGIIPADE